jgi:molecular chaperone DnaK
MAKEEVDQMQKEASSHAEEDRKRLAEVEARNKLDTMIYSVEKLIRENKDKLDSAEIQPVESALEDARKALNEGGLDRLNSASESLTAASHKLAEALYQKTGAAPGSAPGAGPEPTPGGPEGAAGAGKPDEGKDKEKEAEVIDAEYVDVDDKKSN